MIVKRRRLLLDVSPKKNLKTKKTTAIKFETFMSKSLTRTNVPFYPKLFYLFRFRKSDKTVQKI